MCLEYKVTQCLLVQLSRKGGRIPNEPWPKKRRRRDKMSSCKSKDALLLSVLFFFVHYFLLLSLLRRPELPPFHNPLLVPLLFLLNRPILIGR